MDAWQRVVGFVAATGIAFALALGLGHVLGPIGAQHEQPPTQGRIDDDHRH